MHVYLLYHVDLMSNIGLTAFQFISNDFLWKCYYFCTLSHTGLRNSDSIIENKQKRLPPMDIKIHNKHYKTYIHTYTQQKR